MCKVTEATWISTTAVLQSEADQGGITTMSILSPKSAQPSIKVQNCRVAFNSSFSF